MNFTAQFSVYFLFLGTQIHEQYYDLIDSLKLCRCFSLTEVGFGKNTFQIQTIAVYNENTKKFTINSPTFKLQKMWNVNGGNFVKIALVFAQT